MIGSRSRTYEVLRGDRALSLEMLRRLHKRFGIPAEVLIQAGSEEASKSGLAKSDTGGGRNGGRVINETAYGRLLSRALPRVIETEEENERMIAELEKLDTRGRPLAPEEEKLAALMTILVQKFEEARLPARARIACSFESEIGD